MVVNKKLSRLFLCVCIFCQIFIIKDAYADDILGRFDFKSEPIFYVRPRLNSINMYNNQFMITWDAIDECDGYIIYRKVNKDVWKEIAHTSKNSEYFYFDKQVNNEDNFTYTVSAYKYKDGKRLVSKYDEIGLRYIEAPVITKISKYYIRWESCKNVDGYEILYTNSKKDSWKLVDSVSDNTNFYSIASKYKKNRYFTVRAFYSRKNGKIYSGFEDNITLKNKNYTDKSLLFEGDEILKGKLLRDYSDITYPRRIKLLTGADIKVNAYDSDTASSIIKRVEKRAKYFNGYDVIFIAVGSNDYDKNVEVGNLTDNNKKTFCGQLNYIVNQIKKQNSKAKVVFITPSYRNVYGKKTNVNCYVLNNKKGYSLNDYCDAMEQVGKYKNVKVFDSRKCGAITVDNVKFRTVDLRHPTPLAQGRIGCSIVDFLVENEIL